MTVAETSSLGRLLAARLAFWAALLIVAAAVVLEYFTVHVINMDAARRLNIMPPVEILQIAETVK